MELKKFARELRSNMTEAERHLWHYLRGHRFFGLKFKRQKPVGRYIVDFVCLEQRLVIELDGGQHFENVEYDEKRTGLLAPAGYRVVRYWNHDVMHRFDEVVADVCRQLRTATPSQPPPFAARKGEE